MALPRHDNGLSSLAKAMGESMDQEIISKMYGHQIASPSSQLSAVTSISNPSGIRNVTVAGNSYSAPVDHAIQGKMFTCENVITQEMFENLPKNEVKKMMISHLVEQMLQEECIEFTMMKAPNTEYLINMVKVKARVFVTPDSQVRILRENGVK